MNKYVPFWFQELAWSTDQTILEIIVIGVLVKTQPPISVIDLLSVIFV